MEELEDLFIREGGVTPTPAQFKYAEVYIKTGDQKAAYEAAGFHSVSHLTDRYARLQYAKVRRRKGVKTLLKLLARNWMVKNDVTIESLCDKALQAYYNADNVKDQLSAIRLLAEYAPKRRT